MDLSVIIVNWNVEEYLRRCLSSLWAEKQRKPGLAMEVVVIDNASKDNSCAMVVEEFRWVRLISNEENRGFTAACNQGIAVSQGRYILLLNPDTEVMENSLSMMVEYMGRHRDVAALGPKLLNPDGTVQSSRRRFPSMATALVESTPLQRWLSKLPMLSKFYCKDMSDDEVQDVDWLVGACLMMRQEILTEVGPLDERFFMYSEEMDWCYRAKAVGWRVVYIPSAKVVHHYGRSSAQDMLRRNIYFNESKWKFFAKHHGSIAGGLLRRYLLGMYLFQFLEEGAKLALGHKRALRRERLALINGVLRSRLRTDSTGSTRRPGSLQA
ncbi:MAG: hypothetical protein HW403_412 [Dehalococcoidia bacterium]|nr:hypothetical protein [Dehalococcoidia bacterium]